MGVNLDANVPLPKTPSDTLGALVAEGLSESYVCLLGMFVLGNVYVVDASTPTGRF